jgi:hypothetical protein
MVTRAPAGLRWLATALALAACAALVGCSGVATTAKRGSEVATATPTPAPKPPTTEQIQAAFKTAGLPIDGYTVFTVENDDNHLLGRPNQYVAKMSWHDSRLRAPLHPGDLTVEDGGSIEIFAAAADRAPREKYVHATTSAVSAFAEYEYDVGEFAFLRLTHFLTPDQAAAYKAALAGTA